MKIPVRYLNFNNDVIGEAIEFDESTGKITLKLDMDKEGAKLVTEMIKNDAPISMSCKNEPCKPKEK
ncbi:hypothetical protein D4R86_03860 [bacterium]|nr:MAG: hypothetical protein D4R86_03860 [bacterium]